jgi:hypothetical protein
MILVPATGKSSRPPSRRLRPAGNSFLVVESSSTHLHFPHRGFESSTLKRLLRLLTILYLALHAAFLNEEWIWTALLVILDLLVCPYTAVLFDCTWISGFVLYK